MSVGKSSNSPMVMGQHEAILKGLKFGKRVAHRQVGGFLAVSKNDIGRLQIASLECAITSFVETNKDILNNPNNHNAITSLQAALNSRAENLESRNKGFFSLFISTKDRKTISDRATELKKIATKLEAFKETTEKTDSVGQNNIPNNGNDQPSTKRGSGLVPKQKEEGSIFSFSEDFSPSSQTQSSTEVGGGPPPPPPPPASKYSPTHDKLTTNAAKLAKLKGEPEQIKIMDKDHDFGKLDKTISNLNDRVAYAKDIERYVETLKPILDQHTQLLNEHEKIVGDITVKKLEIRTNSSKIEANNQALEQVNTSIENKLPLTMNVVIKDAVVPCTFYPQGQLTELKEKLKMDQNLRDYFLKSGLNIDELRSLEWKKADLENNNKSIGEDNKKINSEIEKLNSQKLVLEEKDTGVKFPVLRELVKQKREIETSWRTILGNLSKKAKTLPTKVQEANTNKNELKNLLSDPLYAPLRGLLETKERLVATGNIALMSVTKQNPENLYREAK